MNLANLRVQAHHSHDIPCPSPVTITGNSLHDGATIEEFTELTSEAIAELKSRLMHLTWLVLGLAIGLLATMFFFLQLWRHLVL